MIVAEQLERISERGLLKIHVVDASTVFLELSAVAVGMPVERHLRVVVVRNFHLPGARDGGGAGEK